MPEKIYYFLNGLILAVLIAINIRSHGQYVAVMVIYAGLWVGVELIAGLVRDIAWLIKDSKEDKYRGIK